MDNLADFLGHDIQVHRKYYRLPEGTLQLAKVSKILLAMERGKMAAFKGQNLDEITIDPQDGCFYIIFCTLHAFNIFQTVILHASNALHAFNILQVFNILQTVILQASNAHHAFNILHNIYFLFSFFYIS
ncbi:hypothetical protein N1851_034056 [Merluccius polli]|uniref:Uncharacterized protein n=1 Tax=Merluccius polli TaxID=89951 RepID=A0AA47M0A8_MERPO|nr:hypothetical protein N1851_034056 [Merluccius polli]